MKNKDYLVPAEAAPMIGWDAQRLRDYARQVPEKLPFPVLTHGTRTQIPKGPFFRYLDSIKAGDEKDGDSNGQA